MRRYVFHNEAHYARIAFDLVCQKHEKSGGGDIKLRILKPGKGMYNFVNHEDERK